MSLVSPEFDDIYFSADDGFAETDYVFIKGCNLPEGWKDQSHFTICETGFGTGLNCLSAAKLFEQTAKPEQFLDIISIEKFPLPAQTILKALSPWQDKLEPFLSRMIDLYPLRINALHPLDLAPNITLHLCFGDIADIMPRLFNPAATNVPNRHIDAWFLDGFAPAKNPDMWCDELFNAIKNFSHADTKLATFTAAGLVKRGLENTGLSVEKIRGFGRKRDMLIAKGNDTFPQKSAIHNKPKQMNRIAIIGAGIAGCAAAHKLNYHNIPHDIYDTADHIASGASGNPLGLIAPKLTAIETYESSFYTSCYNASLKTCLNISNNHKDIEFAPCGSLHLDYNDDKHRRFTGYLDNLGWHNDHMQHLNKKDAADTAGIPIMHNALFYPDAGTINPQKLCKALTSDKNLHLNTPINNIQLTEQEWQLDLNDGTKTVSHILVANAFDASHFNTLSDLPVHKVRGQITLCQNHKHLAPLKTILNFGGYLSPYQGSLNGHVLGASYKKWDEHTYLQDEDDQMNCQRLNDVMPNMIDTANISPLRAAIRCSNKDRFPFVGSHSANGLYYSLAHGSHGLSSAIYGAAILYADMAGRFIPAYNDVYVKLKANRFDKP